MSLHRDHRQYRAPMRRETKEDRFGGDTGCPEVHELSIPGHHGETDGTIDISYTATNPETELEETVVAEGIGHDDGVAGILAAFLAEALVVNPTDPLLTADNFDVQGGPLPNAIYFIFKGNLGSKVIALPTVVNDLTGAPVPTPIVRRASAFNWLSFEEA